MSTEYVTAFEITQSVPDWPFALVGLVPILIAVGIFWGKRKFGWERPGWIFTSLSFVAGVFLVCIIGGALLLNEPTYFHDLKTGNYRVVEGVVANFSPMPYEGHRDECFSVHGVQFCYSDYGGGPGFHQSASHGGPIRDGLSVRITYVDGQILRLEVPKDAAISSAQSASIEETNAKLFYAKEANDPSTREMRLAFLLVAVGWTAWWNLQWRLVMQFWVRPPNRPIVQYAFRIYFAASLIAAIFYLIEQLYVHPPSRDQTMLIFKIAAFMGVGVVLMSWVGVLMINRRNRKNEVHSASSPMS